jgi:hypothetical protein
MFFLFQQNPTRKNLLENFSLSTPNKNKGNSPFIWGPGDSYTI